MVLLEILHRKFLDEFDKYPASSDGSPNWEVTGGTWTVTGNRYQAVTTTLGDKSVKVGLLLQDLRAEFIINWSNPSQGQTGLFIRGEADNEINNCYLITMTNAALIVRKYLNGTPSTIGTYAFAPSPSTDYTIKVHVKNVGLHDYPRIKVYLDGIERINIKDSTNPHSEEGTVGFIAGITGARTIYYDNVDIWGIEPRVLGLNVIKSIGSRIRSFQMELENVEGYRSAEYIYNDDIEIWRGSTTLSKIFAGFIEDPNPQLKDAQQFIELRGRDYTAQLLFVSAIEEYSSQDLTITLKDLLTSYAPQFTQVNMQNTGISLAPSYKKRRIHAIGREMAEMADFIFFADDIKDITFVPETYVDSGKTFDESVNIFSYEFPSPGSRQINRVTVYGAEDIAVMVENRELKQEMGYWKEKDITDPGITTLAEAKKRGEAFLKGSRGLRIGTIDTHSMEDLEVGQLVTLIIPKENINGQFVVLQIEYQEPEFPPTIVTVAEYMTGITEIIAALREEADTLLTTEMDLAATLERWSQHQESATINDTKIIIYKRTVSDAFILGHETLGKLGSGGFGLGNRSGAWVKIHEEENP